MRLRGGHGQWAGNAFAKDELKLSPAGSPMEARLWRGETGPDQGAGLAEEQCEVVRPLPPRRASCFSKKSFSDFIKSFSRCLITGGEQNEVTPSAWHSSFQNIPKNLRK